MCRPQAGPELLHLRPPPGTVLAQLPSQLRGDVVACIYKESLLPTPLFSAVSRELCKAMLPRLSAFRPSDVGRRVALAYALTVKSRGWGWRLIGRP